MMRRNKPVDCQDRIKRLADRVKENVGDNPVFFFDTCSIIDFEQEIRRWKLIDSDMSPELFYSSLLELISPVFVTDHVYEELINHHHCHRINGNPEISYFTLNVAGDMHRNYCNFLRNVVDSVYEIDFFRYATYSASLEAFAEGHKKQCRDPISRTDRELVASALWSRYAFIHDRNFDNKAITTSVIISPDCHIGGISEVLTGARYGYDGLKVVSTR